MSGLLTLINDNFLRIQSINHIPSRISQSLLKVVIAALIFMNFLASKSYPSWFICSSVKQLVTPSLWILKIRLPSIVTE